MAFDAFGNFTAGTKAVARLDRMGATVTGNLESVKHTADMENGMVIALGALGTGQRETFDVKVPATADLGTDVFMLVSAPEVVYNEQNGYGIKDFYIPAGTVARAYNLYVGDTFTVSDVLVTGGPTVVGGYCYPANGVLTWAYGAAIPAGVRLVCKVIEKTNLNGKNGGYQASTVLKVIKV